MSYLEQIVEVIRGEFAELSDLPGVVQTALRLLVASALGAALGFERESKGKAAGLRTHMLVALGAAIFVLVPHQVGGGDAEISRIVQGLVAGIGFLGAGAIVKGKPGEEIEGLTTAASIWMAAAIGMTAGLGREATAIFSTILALLILTVLFSGEKWFGSEQKHSNGKSDNRKADDEHDA